MSNRIFSSDEAALSYQRRHCSTCARAARCSIKAAMRAPIEPRWIRQVLAGVMNPRKCKAWVQARTQADNPHQLKLILLEQTSESNNDDPTT